MPKPLLFFCFLLFSFSSLFSQTLIHYWNFNVTSSEAAHLAPSFTTGGASITFQPAGISQIAFADGTGQNFNVLNLNARNGDASGNHLRVNDPIGSQLVFNIPTSGFTDPVIRFATRRSTQGAGTQLIEYSTNGTSYTTFSSILPNNGDPTLQTLDFSAIPAADNNPNFKIRVSFSQAPGGTSGNNRFDNFTVEGTAAGSDTTPPSVTFSPANGSTGVPYQGQTITVNFSEPFRLIDNSPVTNGNVSGVLQLRKDGPSGDPVSFSVTVTASSIVINPTVLLPGQTYYVALNANSLEDLSDNAIQNIVVSTFITIPAQTSFSPGDLLFVAYQMNAVPNQDKFAFVSLITILPGTSITFTDAKYTSNAQPQCPGGLVWTAATGLAAGTVVTINNDLGTADIGTVTGSTFGLSAGGDQVIVYTGPATNPQYITALSSNLWVPTNVCNGSLSQLPAGIIDGASSINLSTAPGAVSGNTSNAYYGGPMNGTPAQLKASLTNPANWIGSASGTPAQTWPNWAFPGAPRVTDVKVTGSTKLQVIFNRDLDPVTATDPLNYTGISSLASVQRTNNGAMNDTVTLTYATAFQSGNNYQLTVSGVKDIDGRLMDEPYVMTFLYNSSIAFTAPTLSVSEGAGQVTLDLRLTNPADATVDLVVRTAPFSTAAASDYTLVSHTLHFTGDSSISQRVVIPINDDNLNEQDEYFVVELQNPVGLSITGTNFSTIFIRDNDRLAPVPDHSIELNYIGSYDPSGSSNASTEIVQYDSASKRLFSISALQDRLDIADFSNPASVQPVVSINMAPYGGITSVAVRNGLVAVSSPNSNEQLNGSVVFFDINGVFQKQVTVGALPDMITFTPDGRSVLTANEGQPNDSYTVDPEGSISLIDVSGGVAAVSQSSVVTMDFTSFNARTGELLAAGIRKGFPGSTLSQDLEPEYITISPDSKKAWVILQEANAFAVLDLENKVVTDLWTLGKKDHNLPGNGFDASDLGGNVHIANWPVMGLYMPDGIASFEKNGNTFIVGANEGDDREYSAFNERIRFNSPAYVLDSATFPNAAILKADNNLGRLRVTKASGDLDGDGDFDEIHLIGGRSFSIWNANTKSIVYDSGDDFEQYLSKTPAFAPVFNADHESNTPKSRSSSKGPEPEGMALAKIRNSLYAFVGLERQGGVMVYNITDPANVRFVDYKNPRNLVSYGGDNGPEGISFISGSSSPDGNPYLVVANEISGTLSIYRISGDVSNNPPAVSIITPVNNSTYEANDRIELTALATDRDGQVKKVEFFNSGLLFATDSVSPYGLVADGIEAGEYVLTAKATDNEGAVSISDTVRVTLTACTGSGSITGQGYVGIQGANITDLLNSPKYPNAPEVSAELFKFEYGPNMGDNYGARVRGYICAPVTGDYTFYLAADDKAELWLSPNDDTAGIRRIAYLNAPVAFRSWQSYFTQKSAPIHLVKGARYFIQTLHKESTGTDHLSVGWVMPGGVAEGPIPGNRLSPFPAPAAGGTGKNFEEQMLRQRIIAEPSQQGLLVEVKPNPTTTYFQVRTASADASALTIVIADVLGRTLETRQVPSNGTFNVGQNLKPGTYFMTVKQGAITKRVSLVRL